MLVRLRFTGLGWLSLVLLVVTMGAAGATAAAVGGVGDAAAGSAIALTFLVGGAVNWVLGRWLNTESTPEGRERTDAHTINETPMELAAVGFVVFALIFASSTVGRLTSPVLGWLTFGGAIIGTLVAHSSYRERRHRTSVGDREELARARGWRYQAKAPGLPVRWKALVGWRVHSIAPFGVIGGELGGLPFTVFDSMTGLDGRTTELPRTTWAVHLPVAYPRFSVPFPRRGPTTAEQFDEVFDELFDQPSSEGGSGAWTKLFSVTADDLEPECEFAGLVQALFTPEVRAATEANGLIGWRIEGRDLIFTSYTRPAPASPDEIVAGTECLVALARLFPAEAAKLYGTPPATDIPLPTRRGP